MQVQLSLAILLANAIIIIGFFAAGLLFFAPTNRQANRFLALLLFSISCWLIDSKATCWQSNNLSQLATVTWV